MEVVPVIPVKTLDGELDFSQYRLRALHPRGGEGEIQKIIAADSAADGRTLYAVDWFDRVGPSWIADRDISSGGPRKDTSRQLHRVEHGLPLLDAVPAHYGGTPQAPIVSSSEIDSPAPSPADFPTSPQFSTNPSAPIASNQFQHFTRVDSPPLSPVYAPTSPQISNAASGLTFGSSPSSEDRPSTPHTATHDDFEAAPAIDVARANSPDTISAVCPTTPQTQELPHYGDTSDEYEVDALVDSRLRNRLEYQVQWASQEVTWEPAQCLTNCDILLAEYHASAQALGCRWAARRLTGAATHHSQDVFQQWLRDNDVA